MARATGHAERTAIIDDNGTWTYGDLLDRSGALAQALLDGRHDLHGARVLLLASSGLEYVAALWAIWRAGGVAVPLSAHQPPAEWARAAADSRASFAFAGLAYEAGFAPVALAAHVRLVPLAARPKPGPLPDVDPGRAALVLFTSGTTARPKGAVLSHANLQAQIECLVEAWDWRPDDRLLHVLPLNHTHGVVNALACPLWVGAACEMWPAFEAVRVWERLASRDISIFMAVPTIYQRLLEAWEQGDAGARQAWADGARQLRVMISGSAPLPAAVFDRWRQVTGQTLLERYGMTEIGMALSNPLHGERRPGVVGMPLPGVEVRLVDERGQDVIGSAAGELFVRGPGVFQEYWDQPEATAAAFAEGRWFRTGDVAARGPGGYRILGRLSTDIIKTGGEKVSALEVEEALREHPAVLDCAIVGVPDDAWGEAVAAAVVPAPGEALTLEALRAWARPRLAPWKIPARLVVMSDLPRNPMGKVSKPRLAALLSDSGHGT